MSLCDVAIVWPAPGSPALLERGATAFTVIVAHGASDQADVRAWLGSARLVDCASGVGQPLQLTAVRAITRHELPPCAAAFGALAEHRQMKFAEITLTLAAPIEPDPPRTSRLFDLVAGERRLRGRCVAAIDIMPNRLSVAFACDIHFAAFWAEIVDAVHRHTPDLSSRVLDPNLLWERFVIEMNARWKQGEVDLLVLGGDLVESIYPRDEAQSLSDVETNVHRFHDKLSALRVPTFVIPGNHDYRLFPWRPRVFGLHSIGLGPADTRRVLQSAGLWERVPLRFNDLRALHTRDHAGRESLAHHLQLLAPGTDFAITVGGMRLLFASTGADVMVRWRSLPLGQVPQFLRSLLNSWNDPDSEGFYDEQLEQIIARLAGARGAALFFHAPLLNYAESDLAESRQRVAAAVGASRATGSRRTWKSVASRHGVCFHNGQQLLSRLHEVESSITTFSGHIHQASRIEIDRESGGVRAVEMSGPIEGHGDPIRLLVGPALCLKHRDECSSPPGYLVARFAAGQLADLEQFAVGT